MSPAGTNGAAKIRSEFNQSIANRYFARAIGPSSTSFRQTTSARFSKFISYVNPDYHLPSRQTLVNNIAKEASRAKEMISELLKNVPMVTFICVK
jgi:hypothetical protein